MIVFPWGEGRSENVPFGLKKSYSSGAPVLIVVQQHYNIWFHHKHTFGLMSINITLFMLLNKKEKNKQMPRNAVMEYEAIYFYFLH